MARGLYLPGIARLIRTPIVRLSFDYKPPHLPLVVNQGAPVSDLFENLFPQETVVFHKEEGELGLTVEVTLERVCFGIVFERSAPD
jgi:hypothetical protein